MRVILQKVTRAEVLVNEEIVGKIGLGYVLLVGISSTDTKELVSKVADKIHALRVFEDTNGKMNLGIADVGGSVLSVSQFTLYADIAKGRRPGFSRAARPEMANALYEWFNEELRKNGLVVETGIFQTHMRVCLENDGPVTIVLDTDAWY